MPGLILSPTRPIGSLWRFVIGMAALLAFVQTLPAQIPPDQAADMLLNSARKAYNEKNYPFAIARFHEFLGKYGNHKDAASARYGLALSLLDGPEKDYAGAIEQLQPLTSLKEMPDQPYVLYYLGLAQRGQGIREMGIAQAKPNEAAPHRAAANQRFEEASKQFAAAESAFSARVKEKDPQVKELPLDLEWAARARCDLAEMQVRLLKLKEAQAATEPFIKDPLLVKSRYCGLGRYYHGFAAFLSWERAIQDQPRSEWTRLPDYLEAGRALNMLTPFNDPVFGTHARYLLARLHHLADERAEASLGYAAVLADYEKNKKDAPQTLQHPEQFKNDPVERARLEALIKDPPPDHVAHAILFAGVVQYEDGRFADALAQFTRFVQQYPGSPLVSEAQLRQGFCQVQLRQFAEAIKTLQPLPEKDSRLADQAIFWIGKAQVGGADPNNAAAYGTALKTALETFRKAADKAQQMTASDPEARNRRGDILVELSDTQQLARQYKEAAATCGQILSEKLVPQREEEVVQRQATALQLAGDYNGSDQVCIRFQQAYPKSPLLDAVLFRFAENANFRAQAAEQTLPANQPNRSQELANLNEEVIRRCKTVVEKFPESPQINLARYGLAMAFYRKGELDKTREILETIPLPERTGDLGMVSYALADCLIRQTPLKAEDALAAGKIQEQLQGAVELLDGFVAGHAGAPQLPDALLKLGHCHQRLAALLVKPEERSKELASARTAYEKLMKEFPNHPLQPQAILERARCLAQAGDANGSVNELKRFTTDPLKSSPVAPLALLQLATVLRGQNKAADAANVLAQGRQQHEQALLKDPTRSGWVLLLQYHHGAALKEANKLPEARGVFEQVTKQFAGKPEAADAALRYGQCLKEEGQQKIAAGDKTLAEGRKAVSDAAQYLEAQANQLKEKQPTWEVRARMLYETAWCYRILGEPEVRAARSQMQQELLKKLKDEAAKKTPQGATPAVIPLPEVPLASVPLQPSELKARAQYQALIASFSDLPLAGDARYELAEMQAERGDRASAINLLNDALDKEPPVELTEKIRLRLGECHAADGDPKAALTEFDIVAQNPKSPLAAQAQYRAGECLYQLKDWEKAAARLAVFRDQQPYQNLPGLTDRALLRLGQALGKLGRWDQARQAHEQVVSRFGSSPWVHEARYNIGWALENQKQYDNAVNAYNQVAAATATEVGARAQLHIGLCRLEQKRYPEAVLALMNVTYGYDYPELTAAALCEAGRTMVELKQQEQATRLWQRVVQDHPGSDWARVAEERLGKTPK